MGKDIYQEELLCKFGPLEISQPNERPGGGKLSRCNGIDMASRAVSLAETDSEKFDLFCVDVFKDLLPVTSGIRQGQTTILTF